MKKLLSLFLALAALTLAACGAQSSGGSTPETQPSEKQQSSSEQTESSSQLSEAESAEALASAFFTQVPTGADDHLGRYEVWYYSCDTMGEILILDNATGGTRKLGDVDPRAGFGPCMMFFGSGNVLVTVTPYRIITQDVTTLEPLHFLPPEPDLDNDAEVYYIGGGYDRTARLYGFVCCDAYDTGLPVAEWPNARLELYRDDGSLAKSIQLDYRFPGTRQFGVMGSNVRLYDGLLNIFKQGKLVFQYEYGDVK